MRRRWLGGGLVVLALAGGTAATAHLVTPNAALRTFSVGSNPYAVALSSTGRAFVVNRTSDWTGMSANGGSVSIVDVGKGSVVRQVPVGDDPRAIAVDEQTGRIFVANDDDASVSVLDAQTGAPVRTTRVGSGPRALSADPSTHRVYVLTAADNTLSVLDARSGALLRTLRLDASSPSFGRGSVGSGGPTGSRILVPTFGSVALAVLGRHIFVGSGRGVTVLDATSGKVLQTIALGEEVRHLAADPRTGQVFIAGDTTVSRLDARHHYALRSILTGDHPSALAVDTRRGRVLVADIGATDGDGIPSGNGSVALLDATTGAVLRTVGVGVAPGALAVDERSGHVLVVDDGGPVHVQGPWDWLPQWLVERVPFLGSQQGTHTVDGNASILGL